MKALYFEEPQGLTVVEQEIPNKELFDLATEKRHELVGKYAGCTYLFGYKMDVYLNQTSARNLFLPPLHI